MASTRPMDDRERRTVVEFCHLLEESKQRFNTLRDLPQFGHPQWQSFFDRTFDVYTKLWKFQQQHRATLDLRYGLKRWQIGEIASKIGQLYYHYYLRTSEIFYLDEAFAFYAAIRGRSYYTRASREDRCELMVKKLRYYARFIVVCLLLRRVRQARELAAELARQVRDYGLAYAPPDQPAWLGVLDELRGFVEAEAAVRVDAAPDPPLTLTYRLSTIPLPPIRIPEELEVRLEEIVIVGGAKHQVKYSEMSIDMYRIMQVFEKEEKEGRYTAYDGSPRPKDLPPLVKLKGHSNPHKCIMFRRSVYEVLASVACACKEVGPRGALALYISADGHEAAAGAEAAGGAGSAACPEPVGYGSSGLSLRREGGGGEQALYPGDLSPATRRPLFLIVESNRSHPFRHLPPLFGEPLVVLMSPEQLPEPFHTEEWHKGSLFTTFLAQPLVAFLTVSRREQLRSAEYHRASGLVHNFYSEAAKLFGDCNPGAAYMAFFGEEFLRPQLLRFVFCHAVLARHRAFAAAAHRPASAPPLPARLLAHPRLAALVMHLADELGVSQHYVRPDSANADPLSSAADSLLGD